MASVLPPSVDPSLTTRTSTLSYVCPRALSIASFRYREPLYTGITIVTRGRTAGISGRAGWVRKQHSAAPPPELEQGAPRHAPPARPHQLTAVRARGRAQVPASLREQP